MKRNKNFRSRTKINIPLFFKKYKNMFILALFISLFVFFIKSSIFTIENVNIITNNELLDIQTDFTGVIEILNGQKFFEVSPVKYVDLIKQMSPFIKDVYIEKIFPKSLDIYIYYYSADYIIYEDKKCYLASASDKIFYTDDNKNCDLFTTSDTLPIYNVVNGLDIYKNQYMLDDFYKINKVFVHSGWNIQKIILKNKKIFVEVGEKKEFVLDSNEPLEIQLKKLMILTDTIVENNYSEFRVFLGFEKPYLEKY